VTQLAAQLPGESVFSSRRSFRDEYLAKTWEDIQVSLTDWSQAVARSDAKTLRALLTPDALFAPLEGWLAKGGEVLDSLASYTPRLSGYSVIPIDFDASGAMAYVFGSALYQILGTNGQRSSPQVDVTIVLVQRGELWKVRSYIERPRLDDHD
jgi:ketosteroid isomerase-like protein